MSRLLITGAGGMLGRDLVAVLRSRGDLSLTATTRAELDITDLDAVRTAVAHQRWATAGLQSLADWRSALAQALASAPRLPS